MKSCWILPGFCRPKTLRFCTIIVDSIDFHLGRNERGRFLPVPRCRASSWKSSQPLWAAGSALTDPAEVSGSCLSRWGHRGSVGGSWSFLVWLSGTRNLPVNGCLHFGPWFDHDWSNGMPGASWTICWGKGTTSNNCRALPFSPCWGRSGTFFVLFFCSFCFLGSLSQINIYAFVYIYILYTLHAYCIRFWDGFPDFPLGRSFFMKWTCQGRERFFIYICK